MPRICWSFLGLAILLFGAARGAVVAVPAADTSAETAAATQPAEEPGTISRIASGEKKLSVEEVVDLDFWQRLLQELTISAISLIPRLIVAIVCVLIFYGIHRAVRRLVMGSMARANLDESIKDMLISMIKWTIMGFGIVIACNQIGVQITALLTGVGIIGLAMGFAAQETLSNFIAGIVIFWDRPFKPGDWIEIDGVLARVMRVTFRSTRLLNGNGEIVIFPNTHMLSHRVSNHTTNPINRVTVRISIAYKESIDRARQVLISLTQSDSRICKDPPPSVVAEECAASGINLVMGFWVEDEALEGMLKCEYLEKAKSALTEAGIQIPFPHLQLFVEETPAIVGMTLGRAMAPVSN